MPLFYSLPLLLRLAAPTPGQAPPDTARSYRHHLGLTASPQLDQFFTANRSLPIGLLYRRQTRPNRAWRARAVGRYEFNSGDAPLLIGHSYREHTGSLELAWGCERLLPLGRRFTAYTGAEAGARLASYQITSEYYRILPRYQPGYPATLENAITDQYESRTTQVVFLQAVAGLRCRISQRLCAEAEAGLPVSFSRQKWQLDAVEYYVSDRVPTGATNEGANTYYTFTTRFVPISSVRLLFLF